MPANPVNPLEHWDPFAAWERRRIPALMGLIDGTREYRARLRSLGSEAETDILEFVTKRIDEYVARVQELTGEDH